MKAYHIERFGDLDGLVLRDHDVPSPGPRQVLVRLRAASFNYRDLLVFNARYSHPIAPGLVPLSDGAGEVVALGDGANRFGVGDRVISTFFPLWIDGRLTPEVGKGQWGSQNDGMLCELKAMHEDMLVAAPAHLSYEEAATLPCAALTAWSCLTGPRSLLAGETVLTLGTGGVAVFALQLAKLFGAQVISTTSSDAKADKLRALGVDHVVNYRTHPDWDKLVREITNGRGADHIVETTGVETLERSTKAGASDCQIALVGVLRLNAAGSGLDLSALAGGYTLRRIRVGSRAALEAMNRAIALHRLKPVIERSFPFSAARDAYAYFAGARSGIGKVVIAFD